MRNPRISASPGRKILGRERKGLSRIMATATDQKYNPKLKMVRSPRAIRTRTTNQYLKLVSLGDAASMPPLWIQKVLCLVLIGRSHLQWRRRIRFADYTDGGPGHDVLDRVIDPRGRPKSLF